MKGGKREFHWLQLCCIMTFIFLFMVSQVHATTTRTWIQSNETEFSKGATQNVSILSTGEIQLSPKTEVIQGIRGAFVWSMAVDSKNQVFIGTGDPGSVYRIKNDAEAVEVFNSPELYVQSLAIDKQGNLYAGTAPRGIIYKINPRGEASVFCCLPAPYIWDMAVDNDSNIFAATGNDGILFKITPEGKPTVFFDSPETNLLDIHIDQFNNVYLGTEPGGLVYRITPSGQPHVLYNASEGEIHCISMDAQGNLYAGTAVGAQPHVPPPPTAQPVAQAGIITSIFKEERSWDLNIPEEIPMAQQVSLQQQRSAVKEAESIPKITGSPTTPNFIYKITRDGLAQKIFETDQAFILGISLDTQNNLYVATGNKSGIFKVCCDETSSNLTNIGEVHALCCINTSNDELYVGTGNRGKVYKIYPSFVKEGNFISNVFDTATQSNWGCIYWTDVQPAGTNISLATRTGNCEKPDPTWSGWSTQYTSPGERIASPPARFIQYNAALQTTSADTTPSLAMVSLSYLPKNQPPKIINFSLEKESSGTPQKSPDTKTNGKTDSKSQAHVSLKPHHQMAQKNIQWEAEDPNNDTLQLTIYYKGTDEKTWKIIEKNTQKKGSCTWDTLRLPDGKYQIKLMVSDEPDNPPETALGAENTIQSVVIDNSKPIIKSLSTAAGTGGKYIINGVAKDDYSVLVKVQYTLDGQEWISAYPVDGMFDSSDESFQITTKPLTPGDYTLILNAFDSEGNIGIEKVVFEVK
jgi:hypothetical protein